MACPLAVWVVGWKLLALYLGVQSLQTQTVEREQFADTFTVKCASCNDFGAFCIMGTPCCEKCRCNNGRTYFRNSDSSVLGQTCVDYPDRDQGCAFFIFGRQYAGIPLLTANIDRQGRYFVGSIVRDRDFQVGLMKNCQIVREESMYWNNEKWLPLFQDGRSPSDWTLASDDKSKNDLQWSSSNWAPYLGLIIKFAIRCSEGGSSCFMLKIAGSRTYVSDGVDPVLPAPTSIPTSTTVVGPTSHATTKLSSWSTQTSTKKPTVVSVNSTLVSSKPARKRRSFPVLIVVVILLGALALAAILLAVILVRRRRRKGKGRPGSFFQRNPNQQSRVKLLRKSNKKEEVPIYQSPDAAFGGDKPSSADNQGYLKPVDSFSGNRGRSGSQVPLIEVSSPSFSQTEATTDRKKHDGGYVQMFSPTQKSESNPFIGNPVYLEPAEVLLSPADKTNKSDPNYDELKLDGLKQNDTRYEYMGGGSTPSRHVYVSLKDHDRPPVKPHEYVELDKIVVPQEKRQSAGYMGLDDTVSAELQQSPNYEALVKSKLPSNMRVCTDPVDVVNGDFPCPVSPKYFELESGEKNALLACNGDGEIAV